MSRVTALLPEPRSLLDKAGESRVKLELLEYPLLGKVRSIMVVQVVSIVQVVEVVRSCTWLRRG